MPDEPIINKNEKISILEQEGSSRAIVSGAYFFTFGILGSILLWIYAVIATDNPGLAYYGEVYALIGIFQIFSTGFSQSFIARIKAAYIEDQDNALILASSYTRVLIVIGFLMTIVAVILIAVIPDPFIRLCLIMMIPPMIISYIFSSLAFVIAVMNRYDIMAFLSSFYGFVVFGMGFFFILTGAPAVYFTLMPWAQVGIWLIFTLIFFRRVSPFPLKDLLLKGKLRTKDSKEFLFYSSFSTLTNLESIGILINVIIFLTTLSLYIWYPSQQLLGVRIMTIINIYAMTKVAIQFFSSPLNVEVAEARAKNNDKLVEETIQDTGRAAFIIGLLLLTVLCAGSKHLLNLLHSEIFLINGAERDINFFYLTVTLFILIVIGQSFYGYATLFGNALIGSGHARYSAMGFGAILIITFILTPLFVFYFGFLGAGITMALTGIFLVVFMMIAVKKCLKLKLQFKIVNQLPYLTILFLLIWFYPLEQVINDQNIFIAKNVHITLIGTIMLLGMLFTMIIGLPFFGVIGPGDGKIIRDFGKQFNAKGLTNFMIKLNKKIYNMNPFHQKLKQKT